MIIVKLVVLGIVCVCAWLAIKAVAKETVSAEDGSVPLFGIGLVAITLAVVFLLFFAHW